MIKQSNSNCVNSPHRVKTPRFTVFMLCKMLRRKIYAARDFSDKYDFALFKYPIIFNKYL